MGGKSKIEWTEMTWNPTRGCTRVSPGCENCYAERWSAGPYGAKSPTTGQPFAIFQPSGPRWTGNVELIESMLDIPLRRKTPTTWFVNSMSDLFHEALPAEAIDRVFAVMALCPQHTFQILTKRAERMQKRISELSSWSMDGIWNYFVAAHYVPNIGLGVKAERVCQVRDSQQFRWPLPNVWLGVSIEDRKRKDRIDLLRQTTAALRFLSLEPLLEDLGELDLTAIDWVIVGGESGPGARSMPSRWVRTIRDQCVAARVPFFFKQWGEFLPDDQNPGMTGAHDPNGGIRVGKKKAGHLLDSREWREMPALQKAVKS